MPDDFFASLAQNTALTFHPYSCDQTALAEWRSRQRQLAHLDAEISALRNALGLGSDPQLPVAQVTLRTEQDALEDRAFEASDGILDRGSGQHG